MDWRSRTSSSGTAGIGFRSGSRVAEQPVSIDELAHHAVVGTGGCGVGMPLADCRAKGRANFIGGGSGAYPEHCVRVYMSHLGHLHP